MSKLSPDVKAVVMDALRAAFTESRTDDLIRRVTSKLPVWLRWLPIGRALDQALPELLLDFVEEVL